MIDSLTPTLAAALVVSASSVRFWLIASAGMSSRLLSVPEVLRDREPLRPLSLKLQLSWHEKVVEPSRVYKEAVVFSLDMSLSVHLAASAYSLSEVKSARSAGSAGP